LPETANNERCLRFLPLIGDALAASSRLLKDDTPTHRRELVRTLFAGIEGLVWRLKQDVLKHIASDGLSEHERAAMLEETYRVDDNGTVDVLPRYLPLTSGIRLAARIIERYRPEFKAQFDTDGWASLKQALNIRNRLVHPKTGDDLNVSRDEIAKCYEAFAWVLAFSIRALGETLDVMATERKKLEQELLSLQSLH
jgi:hypothetical protein